MEAIGFDRSNMILGPPDGMNEDQVRTVRAHIGISAGSCVVTTCWKIDVEELEAIKRTGRVWVTVSGTTMPPMRVSGHEPEWRSKNGE